MAQRKIRHKKTNSWEEQKQQILQEAVILSQDAQAVLKPEHVNRVKEAEKALLAKKDQLTKDEIKDFLRFLYDLLG